MERDTFTATDSGSNAVATATKAAVANQRHHVTAVVAAYSATAHGTLAIKSGSTALITTTVYDHAEIVFDPPIVLSADTALNVTLAAGGSSITGNVNVVGYTA